MTDNRPSKRCASCQKTKPVSEFVPTRWERDGMVDNDGVPEATLPYYRPPADFWTEDAQNRCYRQNGPRPEALRHRGRLLTNHSDNPRRAVAQIAAVT